MAYAFMLIGGEVTNLVTTTQPLPFRCRIINGAWEMQVVAIPDAMPANLLSDYNAAIAWGHANKRLFKS